MPGPQAVCRATAGAAPRRVSAGGAAPATEEEAEDDDDADEDETEDDDLRADPAAVRGGNGPVLLGKVADSSILCGRGGLLRSKSKRLAGTVESAAHALLPDDAINNPGAAIGCVDA